MGKRRASYSEDSEEGDVVSSPYFDSEYENAPKKLRSLTRKKPNSKRIKTVSSTQEHPDVENTNTHPRSRHIITKVVLRRTALLEWYYTVHESRGMPWRKPFDPSQGQEERAQRAYEVWVSEVMLQQTQVATVIPYYNRWMEKFPTLAALAGADVEEVNALWKGLGYYSRARRLLDGAKKVVEGYGGMLPDNAKEMQANIPGVGRYSAGAICSIAYGEHVPVLDGNVNRLLSRLLALHAPPKAKATLDILWDAAKAMVQVEAEDEDATPHPGDINQALIELGSTVCKVREPACDMCPIRKWCSAYALTRDQTEPIVPDIEDACTICEPLQGFEVTAFPMKVDRKKPREELDIVQVIEWRPASISSIRRFLLIKRPESGLLAGLYDFVTAENVSRDISTGAGEELLLQNLSESFGQVVQKARTSSDVKNTDESSELELGHVSFAGDVSHIFSHIKKTYWVAWVLVVGGESPPRFNPVSKSPKSGKGLMKGTGRRIQKDRRGSKIKSEHFWVTLDEVSKTNMGTGSMKVWTMAEKMWKE